MSKDLTPPLDITTATTNPEAPLNYAVYQVVSDPQAFGLDEKGRMVCGLRLQYAFGEGHDCLKEALDSVGLDQVIHLPAEGLQLGSYYMPVVTNVSVDFETNLPDEWDLRLDLHTGELPHLDLNTPRQPLPPSMFTLPPLEAEKRPAIQAVALAIKEGRADKLTLDQLNLIVATPTLCTPEEFEQIKLWRDDARQLKAATDPLTEAFFVGADWLMSKHFHLDAKPQTSRDLIISYRGKFPEDAESTAGCVRETLEWLFAAGLIKFAAGALVRAIPEASDIIKSFDQPLRQRSTPELTYIKYNFGESFSGGIQHTAKVLLDQRYHQNLHHRNS